MLRNHGSTVYISTISTDISTTFVSTIGADKHDTDSTAFVGTGIHLAPSFGTHP